MMQLFLVSLLFLRAAAASAAHLQLKPLRQDLQQSPALPAAAVAVRLPLLLCPLFPLLPLQLLLLCCHPLLLLLLLLGLLPR
jgi:hypothetical protein